MLTKEGILHQQVTRYLKIQYPNVIFRTDFAAGVKMTMGQATKHKSLQSGRAYPDLFVAEPTDRGDRVAHFCGLYIELKATNIYKKDGGLLKNEHLAEQAAVLEALRQRGYAAYFAVGFDEAKRIIDTYMSGKA